eukprot:UN04665
MTFKEINISSNQIGQDLQEGHVQILHRLAQQFRACNTLKTISFHGNFFDEKIADVFLMMLQSNENAKHITKFTVPHTLPVMVVEAFYNTVQSHKAKTTKLKTKGKKAKKKVKKKKKK